jgi:hypothetical protein
MTAQMPLMPPKPRIKQAGECWVLDTGHAAVLHDTWPDALAHAERICRNYRTRAKQALAFFDGFGGNS